MGGTRGKKRVKSKIQAGGEKLKTGEERRLEVFRKVYLNIGGAVEVS